MSGSDDEIYRIENVPLCEAMYGKGLISLGGLAAVDEMFEGQDLLGKKLLDIGFGIGGIDHYLADKYNAHVTGVEVQAWMCEYAIATAPAKLREKLRFVTYDKDGAIPVEAQSIDLAFSKGVLTNVQDKATLMCEIARLLKPKGRVCFVDWLVSSEKGPIAEKLHMGDSSFKETEASYRVILESCGFEEVRFLDLSKSYLSYARELGQRLNSASHKEQFASVLGLELRKELLIANTKLIDSIANGQQFSIRVEATKS